MYISSGGVHRGTITMGTSAAVTVSNGGVIDLSISGKAPGGGYIINDISCISGSPSFTLTVSAQQAHGTYKLAGGAQNFNKTITIGSNALAVNGAAVNYNNASYKLVRSNGDLSVVVDDIDTTPPDALI